MQNRFKRFLSLSLALMMVICQVPVTAFAEELDVVMIDDVEMELDEITELDAQAEEETTTEEATNVTEEEPMVVIEGVEEVLEVPVELAAANEEALNDAIEGNTTATTVTTADELTAAIDANKTDIVLGADITVDSILALNSGVQGTTWNIDGAGHTITGSGVNSNGVSKTFEVYDDAVFTNVVIKNTGAYGRCVDTRDAVDLTLDRAILNATGTGNTQPLTIGGSLDGTNVQIDNSSINATTAGYAIIAFVKSNISINASELSGWSVLYMKEGSDNSVVTMTGSTRLNGTNVNPGDSNEFALIVVEEASGISVDLGNAVVNVSKETAAADYNILNLNSSSETANTNITVNMSDANLTLGEGVGYVADLTSGQKVSIPAANAADFAERHAAEIEAGTIDTDAVTNAVANVAQVGSTKYTTLKDAIAAATAENNVVTLLRNITLSEYIKINNTATDVVIDGAGFTITGGGTHSNGSVKTFEVYSNVKFRNVTIVNNGYQARCIDTRSKVKLELSNVTLDTTGGSGNTQPLTIGGSDNGTIVAIVNGSAIKANSAGYGIITFVQNSMNIIDSSVEGYAALYMKAGSDGSSVNVQNSSLTGNNVVSKYEFAVIAIESCDDIKVDFDSKSSITANGADCEGYALLGPNNKGELNSDIVVNMKDASVSMTAGATGILNMASGQTISVPASVAADNGYTVDANGAIVAVASIDGVQYATLEDAIAAADDSNNEIQLLTDLNLTEMIKIEKEITIEGNNHTITSNTRKTFEIYAYTAMNDLTIVNTAADGRCVDTRAAVTVALNNVNLSTTGSGNTQPLTIGGNCAQVYVDIVDSNIEAGNSGYGVIVYNPANIYIENSTISGYAALYMKEADNSQGSAGSVVNVIDSELCGTNIHDGSSNNFGVIVTEDYGVEINVTNSKITATKTGTADYNILNLGFNEVSVVMDNSTVLTCNGKYMTGFDGYATVTVPASAAENFADRAFNLKQNADGTVSVKLICEAHDEDGGVQVTAPTCTEKGTTRYTCKECGISWTYADIAATGHTYDAGTITTDPTCVATGVKTYKCACGATKTETVPATGVHSYGDWTTVTEKDVFNAEVQKHTCKVCGKEETRSYGEPAEKILEISGKLKSITMKKGETDKCEVIMAAGDSLKSCTSSKTKVVKVTANKKTGTITLKALKTGTSNVKITLASGKTRTYKVTVKTAVVKTTGISVESTKITLKKGKTQTLKPVLTPFTSTQKITYKTSNKKIVTVTKAGKIKAVAAGTAKITITSGSKKKVVTVTVPGITNVKTKATVKVGKTLTLKPKKFGISEKFTYTSSNKKIATVTANGKVKGIKKGTATITIKAGSYSVKCKVTVKK